MRKECEIYLGMEWTGEIIVAHSEVLMQQNLAILEAIQALAGAFAGQSMSGVKQASETLCEAAKATITAVQGIEANAGILARKSAEHLNRSARV